MSKSITSSSKCGIGAVGVVQIVFIIMKCTKYGVIGTWHWWKVMLPLFCTIGLMCFCGCIACCIAKSNKKLNKVEIDIENHPIPQIMVSNCNNCTIYRVI